MTGENQQLKILSNKMLGDRLLGYEMQWLQNTIPIYEDGDIDH